MYRRINEFRRDYQPRSNLVQDENGDLLADSHNILNRWKNYVLLLNVHRVSDVRQIEIQWYLDIRPLWNKFNLVYVLFGRKKILPGIRPLFGIQFAC
jgi:hypothetical protein